MAAPAPSIAATKITRRFETLILAPDITPASPTFEVTNFAIATHSHIYSTNGGSDFSEVF
jgi:hypothetical protein